ncbi:MAG: TolC family protein [Myxococcota bacterium]
MNTPSLFGLVLIVIVAIPSGQAAAQSDRDHPATYSPPPLIAQPATLPEDWAGRETRALSLSEAIEMAVENNLGITLARQRAAASKQDTAATSEAFEPALTGSYVRPSSQFLPETLTMAGTQRLRWGTELSVNLAARRLESLFDTEDSHTSEISASVSQPLLRGFSVDGAIPRADILRAELASERILRDMQIAVTDTVRRTEDAYWELVRTLKAHRVQIASLRLAEQQMLLTERQIKAGILPQSDLISAEGTLAQRQLALVRAESAIEQAGDQLRQVLNLPRDQWSVALIPGDSPGFDAVESSADETDSALRRAEQNRPELEQRRIDLDQAALDTRIARNQRLPDVRVSASYGLVGQSDSFSNALDQLGDDDARFWSVSLSLSWSPLGRAARARYRSQQIRRSAAQTLRDQELLTIHTEVRQAVRAVTTSRRQVLAAAKARELAERSLDAEQRKFLNGTSSNFFVAQRQAELAQAQQAELDALIGYRQARTALHQATGTLLEQHAVELTVAGSAAPPSRPSAQ